MKRHQTGIQYPPCLPSVLGDPELPFITLKAHCQKDSSLPMRWWLLVRALLCGFLRHIPCRSGIIPTTGRRFPESTGELPEMPKPNRIVRRLMVRVADGIDASFTRGLRSCVETAVADSRWLNCSSSSGSLLC